MAKMFYTLDETKAALGRGEEEIKQLSREGRLREFRDGPRLMFKADQVETLKNELAGGGVVDLGPSDSGAPIGLVDSRGGSGAGISLADTGGSIPSPGGVVMKEDTALSADLGLSGSLGGVPSPNKPVGSGTGLSGTASGRSGITVFTPDEVEHADPMAQTSISTSPSAAEQLNLEGVGSGSGLLDLTRESDDTSLGADLLDEITPGAAGGGSRRPADASGMGGTGVTDSLSEPHGGVSRGFSQPVYVEASDPMAPAFGAAAMGASLLLLFGGFVLMSAMAGTWPAFVKNMTDPNGWGWTLWYIFGAGLLVTIVFFIVGMLIGKSTAR